ncbi:MAG: hypothetical protein GYA14_15815 [Ignavibacteria bacterium]|nr:hypothetical protein [Ignavibacteria bacterium]
MKCNQCGTELMTNHGITDCLCDDCRLGRKTQIIPVGWQVCPKCNGQGTTWFPPNVPYNPTYTGDGNPFECDVCGGKKIIDVVYGLPPK